MSSVSDNVLFNKVGFSWTSSISVTSGDYRLDSAYYTNSDSIIHKVKTEPLSFFCKDIFMGPIFKRYEVLNKKYGVRFFASGEIVSLDPDETYLEKEQAHKLNLIVRKGMILITGYGTIGSVRIVDSSIDNFAVADNVTRIVPKENLGYIACFLSSKFGHQLLNDYASGSAIKFIQAPQIAKIPVPILNSNIVESVDSLFLKAVSCREKSFELLREAQSLVLKYNNLPPLTIQKSETYDQELQIVITRFSDFSLDNRLDSHFYNPIAKEAIENIRKKSGVFRKLNDGLTDRVFYLNRFTRTFVEEGHGIPYLAGKDLIKIRPTDISYLSVTETLGLDEYRLKTEWILMTCSGTLGRTCFIYKNYESWVGTHDLIRIIANKECDAGYIYAFLSSDYGYYQALRFKHGAVIDHLTPEQVEQILIPLPSKKQQIEIGDLVRQAYELRANAIRLEDEAQDLLSHTLVQE